MEKMEYGSKLDTQEAAGLPGVDCCAAISEEEAAALIARLTSKEKMLLYEMLHGLRGTKLSNENFT